MLKTWRFFSFLDDKSDWKELNCYPKRFKIKYFYFFAPSGNLLLRGKESFFQTDSIVFSSNKPNEGLRKYVKPSLKNKKKRAMSFKIGL